MIDPMHLTAPEFTALAVATKVIRKPGTAEMHAFRGMVPYVGNRPKTWWLHHELLTATSIWSEDRAGTVAELEAAATLLGRLRDWHLEMIRLMGLGISREQLRDVFQFAAIESEKALGRIRGEIVSAHADVADARAAEVYAMAVRNMRDQGSICDRISETYELTSEEGA